MRRSSRLFAFPLLLLLTFWIVCGALSSASRPAMAQESDALRSARELEHNSPDWELVRAHLPDPATASPAVLQMEGDILRARRFPVSALDYYRYALQRGGDVCDLMTRMGVTELELGNVALARLYLQKGLKLRNKNAQAWNDLGAIEFMERRLGDAIRDYKRAIKYDDQSAVYHSNLGLAYVDKKDFESARAQLMLALKLDPQIFSHQSAAGTSLHILSSGDRAAFCFEMAKAYANLGNETEMLHALETASQAGMDIRAAMAKDSVLARYVDDPRVVTMVRATRTLRASRPPGASVASAVPPLPPPAPAPAPR